MKRFECFARYGKRQSGNATVEASVLLPLVLLAFLSLLYIVRLAVTYERMQQALNQVAGDLSKYSYLYAVSGLKERHDSLNRSIEEAEEEIIRQQDAVNSFFNAIGGVSDDMIRFAQADGRTVSSIMDMVEGISEADSSFGEFIGLVGEITEDPMEEARMISLALSGTVLSEAKTQLMGIISKSMLKKRLASDLNIPANQLDNYLRIRDGIDRLDFSSSTFLDDGETIDLIVEYSVKPVPDYIFLPEIRLRNRSCVLAWTFGVERQAAAENEDNKDNESIWNIDKNKSTVSQHFGRGSTIDRRFASELVDELGEHAEITPYLFKTIDVIEYAHDGKPGTLITIFSLNPFLPAYGKQSAVLGEIKRNLYALNDFKKASVKDYQIDISFLKGNYRKVVYVIVPENPELPETFANAFEESLGIAEKLGIELKKVQKYGVYDNGEVNEHEQQVNGEKDGPGREMESK